MAVVSALFCCQPIGVVAVIYAAYAMGQNSAGVYDKAAISARSARRWSIASITMALVFVVVLFALHAAGLIGKR
jgi:NhaP-type Na+/H+ or K+/H+ antiporter